MIAGQCEFERVVGDTTAIAWCTSVCDPLAFHKMSLFPSFLCLQAHPSGLAEVLMLHERHASVSSELTPKCTLSISPPTLGVIPFLHRFECDPHGRAK